MSENSKTAILVRGAAQHNLKGIDVDVPLDRMTVVSGVSGSGKSSLVFDTIYAEGQRRYVETFSPYARQFFDRMDKARVTSIEGIPPAIAVEQGNNVRTSRSTVGTLTEIADYLKLLYAHRAEAYSPATGKKVICHTPETVWREELGRSKDRDVLILFAVIVPEKIKFDEARAILLKQGYLRVWKDGRILPLEGVSGKELERAETGRRLFIVQDRLKVTSASKSRFIESVETAFIKGQGTVSVAAEGNGPLRRPYSKKRICPESGHVFPEPTPSLFSFNNPHGACPVCRGFGRTIEIDYNLVIPDASKSLRDGAIRPFQSDKFSECQRDLLRYCDRVDIDTIAPFEQLPAKDRARIINGDPADPGSTNYGPWYGVKGFFEWLETKTYKMHVRVLLSRYRMYACCSACSGTRFQPETLNYRFHGKNLGELNAMPVADARRFMQGALKREPRRLPNDPVGVVFRETIARLGYLQDVGLGYLTLNRAARTLSGGEIQRVHLTACLGSAMVNTLFVLDEPSVGLHARDVASLVGIMHRLRDKGNTLLVVEHDAEVIRSADHLIDLGPGAGDAGGQIVYAGPIVNHKSQIRNGKSLTLDYLAGSRSLAGRKARAVNGAPRLKIHGASQNNLKNIDVEIPLQRFVCVTGVSGSGKSTLIHEVLYKNLLRAGGRGVEQPGRCRQLSGIENIEDVVLVDQAPIGRTPRSNPAVYIGAYDEIRRLYASLPESQRLGFGPGTFSFNAGEGRCPRCGGAGRERVEMQFLSDVYLPCPECDGARFRPDVLAIRYRGKNLKELLDLTVEEACAFFSEDMGVNARKIAARLGSLQRVGLGYLTLGQGVNTLSGGEAQRLKLIGYLSESRKEGALLIFDEPTTGLHHEDVRKLLGVFQELVDAGNSLVVIEHHLEVMKQADWIIDLGPDAGEGGGRIVGAGPPEAIAKLKTHTGVALKAKPSARKTAKPQSGIRNAESEITVLGAREHNLKNLSVRLPRNRFVVLTGVSGSGKSTLAFDLLFSEGQRRFLDCMSSYARQYVEQLSRPDVDLVEGLPPSVAIEQRVTRGGWKSTVATVTELYHFVRLLYARAGIQHCPVSGRPIIQQTATEVIRQAEALVSRSAQRLLVPVIRDRKGFHTEIGQWALKRGSPWMRVDGGWVETRRFRRLDRYVEHTIDVMLGRLPKRAGLGESDRQLIREALQLGKGVIYLVDDLERQTVLSTERYSPETGRCFTPLDPKDFSFNSPRGWCPACRGYGMVWPEAIEEDGQAEPEDVGVACSECSGARLKQDALFVKVDGKTIAELVKMSVAQAAAFFKKIEFHGRESAIARDIVPEILERLSFLQEVGLGYLELGRAAVTLSGGESQRIRLAAQLGSNLRGVIYVLDEPTIGLHASDNQQLLRILRRLRDRGNSLVVVEHDEDTMRQADWLIDLGPGAGRHGGEVVYSGPPPRGSFKVQRSKPKGSTLDFLENPMTHPIRGARRSLDRCQWLTLEGVCLHNLKSVTARIPLGRLTGVSGVSGSGKSSLITDSLRPAVRDYLAGNVESSGHWKRLEGADRLRGIYEVDQSPIGKTPRSCPATYLGIFSAIRGLFAQTPLARMRGYGPGRFSFNAATGRCPVCEGQGKIRLRMNFLPDTYVPCGECEGRRFNAETLEVAYRDKTIADILEMNVEEAARFFEFSKKIHLPLKLMNETGLGYLALGQSSPTLSGGEAQRLKLVSELMRGSPESQVSLFEREHDERLPAAGRGARPHPAGGAGNLYLLEEPTIGLHFSDVQKLIEMLHRLVDLGHTVVVIEHQLDLLAEADYLLDLGPGGGDEGGRIVAAGTPEQVAGSPASKTGPFLRSILKKL